MSVEYTNEQNQVLVDVMEEYREFVEGESSKQTERLTKAFAQRLIRTVPILADQSVNGVAERLVYFDNLLAGVTFPFGYYLNNTFEKYFGRLPRKAGNNEPNKWKTQHESRRERSYKTENV